MTAGIKINFPANLQPHGATSPSAIRRNDGVWYVSIFVANREDQSLTGMYVFKWKNGWNVAVPVSNKPYTNGRGQLCLGQKGAVQLWGIHQAHKDAPVEVVLHNVGNVNSLD